MNRHKRWKWILGIIACLVIVLLGSFGIYAADYYRAKDVDDALKSTDVQVVNDNGMIRFLPEQETDTGMIFYPGGKVEYTAYAPLMKAYAERGIACVLVKMPFNLAVFDVNAADDVYALDPEISHWYIGGHSLGGAMAAVYASKNADKLDGLVLLGAYSTKDLSDTDLKVVLIDGSEDQVMNHEKAEECLSNYPESTYSFLIAGGNHSQFGSYGHQKGDGEASITPQEQWRLTVKDTLEIIEK